jgi:Flp pilus assembly protein TadG
MAGHFKMSHGKNSRASGTQLLELAFALPFLAVTLIGIIDFGRAYHVKHILTNAAREGARIAASTQMNNSSCACTSPGSGGWSCTPCSIRVAADAVKEYLTDSGLSAASCINASTSNPVGVTWTYSCSSVVVKFDRGYVIAGGPNGTSILATQVTVTYPYTSSLGQIIKLFVSDSTVSMPTTLTSNSIMQSLVY